MQTCDLKPVNTFISSLACHAQREDKPAQLTPACHQTLENNISLLESLCHVLDHFMYAKKSP